MLHSWQPQADGPCGWVSGTNHPSLCGLMTNHPNRHPANHWIAFINIPKCFNDGQKKVTFLLHSWTYTEKSWKYHGNLLACATIKSIVGFKFNIPVHPKSSYTENYTANYTWVTSLNKFLLVEAANIAHYHLGCSLLLCVCIALVAMPFSDLTDFLKCNILVVTQAGLHWLICMHSPLGAACPQASCVHIRQCTPACVTTIT